MINVSGSWFRALVIPFSFNIVFIFLKVYKPNASFPNGGKLSQYLDSLPVGSKIDVAGPVGRIVYKRNGQFEYKLTFGSPLTKKSFKKLGMIAGGTGIL